ncbi:MAG: hypothetical protein HBSAPP03_00360 [Phycisphaerae bacterium]|nr:MAG: hypothetical protein HBSAPP03_00360 [Phycisphaerae bacterium]
MTPPRAAEVAEPSYETNAQPNLTRVSFAEEGSDFDPAVSRDGARLVFASTQHRATSDIYVKRVDSKAVTQLTTDPADDEMPAISPDGNRVAFASNRSGNWDIYVMPISGGKAVQVTDDPADEIHPSWSPDGQTLVFNRRGTSSARWEMWTANVGNPTTPTFIGYGLFPRWCPIAGTGEHGGDLIAYQLPRERGRRSFGVWTLELANGVASNQTEIASSADAAFIKPSWSPDGSWIVYAEVPAPESLAWRGPTRSASGSLWMLGVNGEGRVRLTGNQGLNVSPVWTSGTRLFFVSNRSGSESIWSMDVGSAVQAAGMTGGKAAPKNSQTSNPPRADNTRVTTAPEPGDPR